MAGPESAGRRQSGVQVEGRARDQDMQPQAEHAHRLTLADVADGGEADFGPIDNGDAAAAFDFNGFVGPDECRGVLVEADADGERVVGERGDEPAQAVALAEMLVDDEAVGQT